MSDSVSDFIQSRAGSGPLVERDLPEDGFAAFGDDDGDLTEFRLVLQPTAARTL